jgi:peptidoglycan/LPS O-acetylase OafA/YrhL
MAQLFELRATPIDVVLRAVATILVVANHATPGDDRLGGGAVLLLMLSGLNVARFAIHDRSPHEIRRSILATALRVFVPSLVAVLLGFALAGRMTLHDLLFVSNWGHEFPGLMWFAQVLLQVLAALYLLSWIPMVARATARRPALAMVVLFGIGVLLRVYKPFLVNGSGVGRLPHTMLWLFALGAVVYFLAMDPKTSRPATKGLAAVCVMAGLTVAYDPGAVRFWWILVGGFLLIAVRSIPLPHLLTRVTTVVSAASLGIYLAHLLWFRAIRNLTEAWAGPGATVHPVSLFSIGVVLSTATWVAVVAFGRAYRAMRLEPVPARDQSAR